MARTTVAAVRSFIKNNLETWQEFQVLIYQKIKEAK